MSAQQEHVFDDMRQTVGEYAQILQRRWRIALLGASFVSAIAFWASQYVPREYSAATLFERRDDAVLRNLIHSRSPYSFDQLKSSIVIDMTGSRALAEAAIKLGLLEPREISEDGALDPEEMKALNRVLGEYELHAELNIIQSSQSLDTLQLECTSNNPTVAQEFAVALRDGYIMRTRDRIREILVTTHEFFEQEYERYQDQIANSSGTIQKKYAEFPGLDPTDPTSTGTRLESLQLEHLRLVQHQAELEAEIGAAERFLDQSLMPDPAINTSGALPSSPSMALTQVTAVDRAIEDVEQQLADAVTLKGMTSEHPEVIALRRKLDSLHKLRLPGLEENENGKQPGPAERLAELNPVLASQRMRVELELDSLRPRLEVAKRAVSESQERLNSFKRVHEEIVASSDGLQQLEDQLERDIANAAVWRDHLTQLERILAAESEQRGTQFTLIESPAENGQATRPRVAEVFAVCSGCGLAIAALLVALAELLDSSFRSAGQVSRTLGLPVLACVAEIPTPAVKRKRMARRMAWAPALIVAFAAATATATLAYTSLVYPGLHQSAIGKVDAMLETVGAPRTSLGSINR